MAPEIKIKPKNNNDVIGHSSDVMALERKWERRRKKRDAKNMLT